MLARIAALKMACRLIPPCLKPSSSGLCHVRPGYLLRLRWLSMQELNIKVKELWSVDKKKICCNFVAENPGLTDHHFQCLESVKDVSVADSGKHLHCTMHAQLCALPSQKLDLMVAGPPCAPYSHQRSCRFSEGFSMPQHPHNKKTALAESSRLV